MVGTRKGTKSIFRSIAVEAQQMTTVAHCLNPVVEKDSHQHQSVVCTDIQIYTVPSIQNLDISARLSRLPIPDLPIASGRQA